MKRNILKYLLLVPAILFALTSCRNDEEVVNNIKIEIEEVGHGHGSSHSANEVHAGEDLHMEVKVEAPNKIANINVKIALKNANNTAPIVNEDFSDYNGQINANFHKHIDIPVDAKEGDYVVEFSVKDQKGLSKTEKAALKIEAVHAH